MNTWSRKALCSFSIGRLHTRQLYRHASHIQLSNRSETAINSTYLDYITPLPTQPGGSTHAPWEENHGEEDEPKKLGEPLPSDSHV